MSLIDLTFSLRKWEDTQSQIIRMRKQVFMDEYNLPLNFLRHKDDAERYHVVAYDDLTGRPVGTGCIHSDGHIGRMAILHSQYKATSVAHVIVDYLMHISHVLKQDRVWLNANSAAKSSTSTMAEICCHKSVESGAVNSSVRW